MKRFVVFSLYGPLAAWGDIAVGEQRPVSSHPSRSAVLGLIAGALGLRRDQTDALRQLDQSYRFGVRVESEGLPLRDFHTVQRADKTARLSHLLTRRDELADPHNVVTTPLSIRDYRCDAHSTVCLEHLDDGPGPGPDAVIAALARPHFVPYLGRKSCPPALPFAARVMEAQDMLGALAQYDGESDRRDKALWKDGQPWHSPGRQPRYYWEEGYPSGLRPQRSLPRHDQVVSRKPWQFQPRTEHDAAPPAAVEQAREV